MKRTALCFTGLLAVMILSGCSRQVMLFNGQNLDGWTPYLQDQNAYPATVWSVSDGVIRCEGKPYGYLRTQKEYSNYKLHVEWRWPQKPTNSGVLLHVNGNDKLWPQNIEAQLHHTNAGDFITVQEGTAITVNGERHTPTGDKNYKVIPKQHESSEHPPGQWNSYDIVCKDDMIRLTVNGVLQNVATEASPAAGAICLQAEGSPIEFRNITLTPLK